VNGRRARRRTGPGDLTGGSTRASSWPSTPMTPMTPTPSDPVKGMPSLKLTEGGKMGERWEDQMILDLLSC